MTIAQHSVRKFLAERGFWDGGSFDTKVIGFQAPGTLPDFKEGRVYGNPR